MRFRSAAVLGLAMLLPLGAGASAAQADPGPKPKPSPEAAAATRVPPSVAPSATIAGPGASTPDPWAVKPYMGWSSYSMQVYSGNGKWITGDQLIKQSDAMKAKLQKYGYNYINVDAGWNDGVDANGRPKPSSTLYPQGLQKVIDHVHKNGQKFGLYMIPGISPDIYNASLPIAGAPGCTTHDIVKQPIQQADYWNIGYRIDFANPCSQKYIDSIADLFGSWGVNFVKFDSVTPGSGISDLSLDARDDVAAWSSALKRNKIWFELSWALDPKYADYWRSKANGWRIDWDVECYCANEALTQWQNVARLFPDLATWWRNGGNGGWNDLDSLNIGNGTMDGLTQDERRTAMTLWAISAAPLYLGNDLTKLDTYGLSLLTNPEVIAVDQAGTPARPVSATSQQPVWYALNPDGSYTVALFNLGRADKDITATWSDIGLTGAATVRDLWARKDLGRFATGFTAPAVPIHGVRLLKVTPQAGAKVAVNNDALRVGYTGDWSRNGGKEVAATSQPLELTVTDTGATTPPSTSGPVRTIIHDNTDTGIAYAGTWSQSTGRGLGDYNDNVHYTERNGDSFQYTFTGTGVSYVTEMDSSQGDVDIYLDGTFVKTVNTGREQGQPRLSQQAVFTVNDLPNGSHTLMAVKKSGSFMLLDRIDVLQPSLLDPPTASFDKKAPADVTVKLLRDGSEFIGITGLTKGTDYTVSGSTVTLRSAYLATLATGKAQLDFAFRGDYLDDVHATTVNGDSVSYAFSGTGVEWITAVGPDQGLVDIYIDGKLSKRVDTNSAARATQKTVFTVANLKNTKHTFKAVKVSGDVLRTDVIRYTTK
ncbi:X2-like carbohydrate binding domain-containing protein [Paractinoplanes atraurantiacus]|uniref:Alpha-galactosidase n=1 Tax=Paractinoplanes atraurantiacus TaxID=1036182 RepID=A0A285KI36_9ACTN|nr:X2-like carbohydrate binding domain-containing protein [Actinoplanes atraurantiacus]SNY72278.1 Carbohydrate binding domain X2 [Actinoplanes atraurantiacus]